MTGQDICDYIKTSHLEHCPLSGVAQISETEVLLIFVKESNVEANTVLTKYLALKTDCPWWSNLGERHRHG